MSERPRKRASTHAGYTPARRLFRRRSRPLLAIVLVLSPAWTALAVSARIPRSPADPFVVPSSTEYYHTLETLTWRQRTAAEWAAGAFEHTDYTAGSGVALTRAVFKVAHAGDYDDKVRATQAMIALGQTIRIARRTCTSGP